MSAGRPPIFKTPDELQEAIDWYFFDAHYDSCGFPRTFLKYHPTVAGLALALGFSCRQSITDYSEKDEFSSTIKKAKLRIEQYLEEALHGNSVTGIIFNLKNNFGWKDKTEHEHTINESLGDRLVAAHKRAINGGD
jgi:hypothetical protein